jgi:L-arabinokinase
LVSHEVDPLYLATLCQEAENHVVGAPCGIMDQVTVALGVPGAVLPILCRPASVSARIPLPPEIEVVGWPTGAEHDVSGAPYRRARVAAFMGKRIVEHAMGRSWSYVSEVPVDAIDALPESLDGAEFVARWGHTDDAVTAVEPSESYPVQAATRFGIEEHARSTRALAHLQRGEVDELGLLLAASHAGYDAMGLGHPAATAARNRALAHAGVYGARSSGGGCGGTVVVVCARGALEDVAVLIR